MKHLISCALILAAGSFSALADGKVDEDIQIKSLPLPDGVLLEKIESLADEPAIKFSQKYSDFAFLDPFLMERRENKVPEHVVMRFQTDMKPRVVFLFFKRYFNMESRKRSDDRKAPFYNSRSINSFDVENEADIPRDPSTAAAVYYRIDARGSGKRLNIISFSLGGKSPTTGYIIAQTTDR